MAIKGLQSAKNSTTSLKVFASFILLLGLCLSSEAETFEEAQCRPRPQVVPVSNDHKYRPYHIVLYRCSGTVDSESPSITTCGSTEQHEVSINVIDDHRKFTVLKLKNDTKCGARCAVDSCSAGMFMDKCRCTCLNDDCDQSPKVSKGTRPGNKTSLPLPYMVGMALVGFFAVIVLVFDAMLCVKKKGFMHTIKHSCCGNPYTDKNENQNCENQRLPTELDEKQSNKVTIV